MKKALIGCVSSILLMSCGRADAVRLEDSAAPVNASPSSKTLLSEIDLAAIDHIASKGRVQDREYNQSPVVEQLLAHGKESIPYLISQLEEENKLKAHVLDYWSDARVGDVALIILTDFFTDKSLKRTTVSGVGWNEFLGGETDVSITGEERLRNYIALRGRKSIRERWLRVWEQHKDTIVWDTEERCFVSKNAN